MKLSETLTCFTLCLILAGTGCTATKQYKGDNKPFSDVAILLRHENGWITEIDGRWWGFGNIERYDFLPGKHTLKVHYGPPEKTYQPRGGITLVVNLKSGHIYDLLFTVDTATKKWNAVV